MKKFILAMTSIAALIGLSAYMAALLGTKKTYDKTKMELANHVLSGTTMNDEKRAWLKEVRSAWTETTNQVGGPHTEALQTLGWEPSVSSLVKLMTYRMPEYSLVGFGRNKYPLAIGTIQAILIPISMDKSIHVSGNRNVALIQHSPIFVTLFQNDNGGLREIQYYQKNQQTDESSSDAGTASQNDELDAN